MPTRIYLSTIRPRGGAGGGAFVYPLLKGVVGVPQGDLIVTEAVDLGQAGDGPERWLQPTKISVRAGQTVALPVVLRPGVSTLKPTGRIDDEDFSNYRPLLGELHDELANAADFAADAAITAADGTETTTKRLWHVEGAFYDLVVTSVKAPDIFSVLVNTAPAGLLTAFKPGSIVSLTVTAADSAFMDKVFINGVLAYTPDEPDSALTFDWTVPSVPLQGLDMAYGFDISAKFASMEGEGGVFTLPLQVPALLGQANRVEDYPGSQVALKGTEQVIMTGRMELPSTGAYTFAAVPPAGMSVVSQTYTPVDGSHTDYSIMLARTTAAEGQPSLQVKITGVSSGMEVTVGEHKLDVQLSAPTIAWQDYRLKFGTGTNTVKLRSNKKLQTRPVMANFTATTETKVTVSGVDYWDYAYTRTNITAPAGGEMVGISAVNSPTITTVPVGGSGITGATVSGTYKLYGWFGNFAFTFATPYVKKATLSSTQQQALVDPGTVTAGSNATDAPTWRTENSGGAATAVPAATHIALTNSDVLNASGTATLTLTST